MTFSSPTEEALHWRYIASYLASCAAATVESLPVKTSKRERERHKSICRKAAAFLKGEDSPPLYCSTKEDKIRHAIERCEQASADVRKALP